MTDQTWVDIATARHKARMEADRKITEARAAKDAAVQAVIDAMRTAPMAEIIIAKASALSRADQALAAAIKEREELS